MDTDKKEFIARKIAEFNGKKPEVTKDAAAEVTEVAPTAEPEHPDDNIADDSESEEDDTFKQILNNVKQIKLE